MKYLKYLLVGILFGIVLTKGEIISWYRFQEMFRFQAFHMYGVIGSAVILGAIIVQLIKRSSLKSTEGSEINIPDKKLRWKASLIGGTLFGIGWAATGACPGPIYILIGNGFTVSFIVLLSALLGTFVYGIMKDKLPE